MRSGKNVCFKGLDDISLTLQHVEQIKAFRGKEEGRGAVVVRFITQKNSKTIKVLFAADKI